jgi:3-isopropylmalate/(R)-2-methylmalate dehydratase small subunit
MSASHIQRIAGPTLVLRGDDVDTDRIIPARFLKAITFDGLEAHVFEDDRAEATRAGRVHPFDDPVRRDARVLFVNHNFGCGSSREHAPQALYRRGIRAVVGTSFAEIFFGNSVAIGLACLTVSAGDLERLMTAADADPGAQAVVTLDPLKVTVGAVEATAAMPPAARQGLMDGTWDVTGLLLENYAEVERTARQIPYLRNFAAD